MQRVQTSEGVTFRKLDPLLGGPGPETEIETIMNSEKSIADLHVNSEERKRQQAELEKLCLPHNLVYYKPVSAGFKYSLIGLFGLPENLDPQKPGIYTVLATAVPPGDALKPLESRTMTASCYFANVDFEKSRLST